MLQTLGHFINNEIIYSLARTAPIYDPAEGIEIRKVGFADKKEVELAIAAAEAAFPAWSGTSPLRRVRILFKFKSLLEENADELANLITEEHGKTHADALGSIQRGIDVVEFACGIPSYLQGNFAENVATEIDCYSLRQPLGVCLGITPFNFPAMIPLWMFAMSIACGNTFILKPSEKDPSSAIFMAELAKKAGLPPGVLNVIQGDKTTVDLLLTHPKIKAVSFVGSTPVAQYVYHTAAANNKRVQAFGGAKNHCIVMPDVDLDETADTIVGAAYGSAGERCMAISVVVALEPIADTLSAKIAERIQKLKIGSGKLSDTQMGPLVTKEHWQRVNHYIELGVQEGAKLIVDGRKTFEKGFYMGPSLFDLVTPSMRIYQEEIFGPVLSLIRAPDLPRAIELINQHPFGNGTAIFTQNGAAARTFVNKVEAGMVGVNIPIPVPVAFHSFGGWKNSMFGDIGMHGPEAVRFYTKLKTVTQRFAKLESHFHMPTFHKENAK